VRAAKPPFLVMDGWYDEWQSATAFTVAKREADDALKDAGIKAGGIDIGTQGLRPVYHPGYYGSFLTDPDGNNVEAVFHAPS
ncbi:MAG: VOC family protein, partial [Proteobacteria bacterium]|nr:VOC family protein [Pseudomonadota bacterium]